MHSAMKQLCTIAALALSGCATTSAGLAETAVEQTVASPKSAEAFAVCVAESLPGGAQLRSLDGKFWVLVEVFGVPRYRADFLPTETGSIALLRSTAATGWKRSEVARCS